MLNSELAARMKKVPEGFKREFDAHIYYRVNDAEFAEIDHLRAALAEDLKHLPILVGHRVDYPVGPHPLPMFEVNFSKKEHDEVVAWFKKHRKGRTILVHEVTGYDKRDHSSGAIWLGEKLELDETKLDPDPEPGSEEA